MTTTTTQPQPASQPSGPSLGKELEAARERLQQQR